MVTGRHGDPGVDVHKPVAPEVGTGQGRVLTHFRLSVGQTVLAVHRSHRPATRTPVQPVSSSNLHGRKRNATKLHYLEL